MILILAFMLIYMIYMCLHIQLYHAKAGAHPSFGQGTTII